ncbi:sensor histidine kinase [Anaerostipes sp.]|uniref:sensor histidine kinase n=1 Tax=Anaerostipes sp. TaxID=1872530 RepID=UPI0025B83DD5|nr:HAMP domain-containing sensor histidine kinase [Anaerostipes sp.]MBS7008098.1 HAMP domain-containing histidine kinase [Anaerostipes sp.]
MDKMMILAAVFAIAALYMGLSRRRMKKEIYAFTNRLESCLDAMALGREMEQDADDEDTLWSKVYERLKRLDRIWQKKNAESLEEKKKIKELISDISHQTKTPIANIKLYVELLQEEGNGQEHRFLQKIGAQTEKLDFLLKSMVKMSRLETGVIGVHCKRQSLSETLGRAVSSIVPKSEQKQIRLSVDCDSSVTVMHDSKWTEEALFNILENAVKYTGQGGSIRVSVSVQEIFTKISIKDTGKGIAPERQAEIFARFYREPEVYDQEGIGVGLYLARNIMTLQNGYIEVRSEPGAGADFRLYLPNR